MERKIKLSPSIIAVDYDNANVLKETLSLLEKAKLGLLHLDVMDGVFVPNKHLSPEFIQKMHNETDFILDVHLMIKNPEKVIDKYILAGADILTVHYESTDNLVSVLQKIKASGRLAGVSINPQTSVEELFPLIEESLVDLVLVMGVNPGACGQKFNPEVLFKIRKLRQKYPKIDIEIDGGVNLENIDMIVHSGANIVVSGSAIFNAKDPLKVIKEMKSYKYEL